MRTRQPPPLAPLPGRSLSAHPVNARAQCDAGEPPPRPARLVTLWQRLLYGQDIVGMVHILGFAERAIEGEPV